MKSRTPHHVRDIEQPAVLEQRQSVASSHHSRDTLDARIGEVPGLDPDEGCSAVKHLGTCLTPDRIRNAENPMKNCAKQESDEPEACSRAIEAKRYIPGGRPRHPHLVRSAD